MLPLSAFMIMSCCCFSMPFAYLCNIQISSSTRLPSRCCVWVHSMSSKRHKRKMRRAHAAEDWRWFFLMTFQPRFGFMMRREERERSRFRDSNLHNIIAAAQRAKTATHNTFWYYEMRNELLLLRWGIGIKKRQKGTTSEEVKETQVVGRRPEHRRNVEENVRRVRSFLVVVGWMFHPSCVWEWVYMHWK